MAFSGMLTSFLGDYFSDRLVRVYSTMLFLMLALLLAGSTYLARVVSCWAPAYFTSNHVLHTNDRCSGSSLLSSLNHAEIDWQNKDEPPLIGGVFDLRPMKLYPVVLAAQALLFLLPWIIWRYVSNALCHLDTVIKESRDCIRSSSMSDSATALAGEVKSLIKLPWLCKKGDQGGYLLVASYLAIRLLSWIICFVQLGIISAYFGIGFDSFHGTSMGSLMAEGEDDAANMTEGMMSPEGSAAFPRVVFCNFSIKLLGERVHRNTVMCNLHLSEVTEYTLLVVRAWLVMLLVVLFLTGAMQLFTTAIWWMGPSHFKGSFLKKRLPLCAENAEKISEFGRRYLRVDVLFLLTMVEEKASVSVVRAALACLWREFGEEPQIKAENNAKALEDI